MVGFYMDAPSPRIAWDRDGSILTEMNGVGVLSTLSLPQRQLLNGESELGIPRAFNVPKIRALTVIFPIPMDCTSVFFSGRSAGAGSDSVPGFSLQTSKDSTNGVDGTWTTQRTVTQAQADDNFIVKPAYRIASNHYTLLVGSDSAALRAVRFQFNNDVDGSVLIKAIHIYGSPSSTATADRLAFWHPTLDQVVSPIHFDWGDVPTSSSADKSFRLKNLSATQTAKTTFLYIESLTPGVPSVAGMHTLSVNNGSTFFTTQTIPLIAPGAISPVYILRRTVPATAQTSTYSARLAADVALWEV